MAMDNKGDLYCVLDYYAESKEVLPAKWFANAYCKTPHTGYMNHFGHCDAGIIKISNDGNVAWASWIGGTGGNDWVACVGVDSNHCPVILMRTASADMPTTPDAHSQALPKGLNQGGWLGKLSADGSKLIFGTYIADAFPRTHNLALDAQGNIFICTCTKDWPATPGALQTKFGGGPEDFGVAKFSPTGKLLAATYIGGNGDETNGPDQIVVDASGNVVIAGSSSSTDYPMTAGAFQPKNASPRGAYPFDGVVSMLSSDLGTLLYSTYVGGTGDEMARACFVGQDGTLYVGGVTTSKNFPVKNAWQPNYGGNPDWDYFKPNGGNFPACWGNGDCFIMKLRPDATAAQTPVKDR